MGGGAKQECLKRRSGLHPTVDGTTLLYIGVQPFRTETANPPFPFRGAERERQKFAERERQRIVNYHVYCQWVGGIEVAITKVRTEIQTQMFVVCNLYLHVWIDK